MLIPIVLESLRRRRRRKLLTMLAVALGIGVSTVVATIALDVGDKVRSELSSFGANLTVAPAADGLAVSVGGVDYRPAGAGAFLPESALPLLKRIFWRNNIVAFAPFLYAPATIAGRPTVIIGTWFRKPLQAGASEVFVTGLEELHPSWKVTGEWPADAEARGALVGRRLAERAQLEPGSTFTALGTFAASARGLGAITLTVRGIVDAGGAEDDQVFAPLTGVQSWAGLEGKVRRIAVSALIKPDDALARADVSRLSGADFDRWYCSPYAASIAYQIEQAIPGARARPVYQVAETEGRITRRAGALAALLEAAALVAAGLAVGSMMLATVLDRGTEIGLLKALGATNAPVAAILLGEAGLIGLAGGLAGYAGGTLLARPLAGSIFASGVGVHWVLLPACLGLALLVTLAGSALPLAQALAVAPARALRD